MVAYFALLALAFVGMTGVFLSMTHGSAADEVDPSAESHISISHFKESPLEYIGPIILGGAVLLLGFYMPPQLASIIEQASQLLGATQVRSIIRFPCTLGTLSP